MILLMLGIWCKLRSAPTHLPHQLCGNMRKYASQKCFLCLAFPSGATKITRMIIQQGIRETIWSCLCLAYIFHDWRKFFIFHASKLWYFNERLLLSCLRVVTPDMLWTDILWYIIFVHPGLLAEPCGLAHQVDHWTLLAKCSLTFFI